MKCRICGCTPERGCPAGCGWHGREDICTVCAAMREHVKNYLEMCYRVTAASLARLLEEAKAE